MRGEAGGWANGRRKSPCLGSGWVPHTRLHTHTPVPHSGRCAHSGRIHRHAQTRSAGSPPRPPSFPTDMFRFLEVCCPGNLLPFKDFLDAAASSHPCGGVPQQTLPGTALFHLFRVPERRCLRSHQHDRPASTYARAWPRNRVSLPLAGRAGPQPLPRRRRGCPGAPTHLLTLPTFPIPKPYVPRGQGRCPVAHLCSASTQHSAWCTEGGVGHPPAIGCQDGILLRKCLGGGLNRVSSKKFTSIQT